MLHEHRSCGTRALHLPPALTLFVLLEHLPLMGHLANASCKGKSQLDRPRFESPQVHFVALALGGQHLRGSTRS